MQIVILCEGSVLYGRSYLPTMAKRKKILPEKVREGSSAHLDDESSSESDDGSFDDSSQNTDEETEEETSEDEEVSASQVVSNIISLYII